MKSLAIGLPLSAALWLLIIGLIFATPRSSAPAAHPVEPTSEAPYVGGPLEPRKGNQGGLSSEGSVGEEALPPWRRLTSEDPFVKALPPAAPPPLTEPETGMAGAATVARERQSHTVAISAMWSGEASWYDDGDGLYGAVHSYRFGDPRYDVKVCRADDDDVCVTVTVRDHMANPVRAIDLSPEAFSRLAPLSRGVVQVTVTDGGPRVTLPPTDVAP